MPVCHVCGSNYSFWKKECPVCQKSASIIPPTQMQIANVDPVSLIIHQVQTGQHTFIPSNINLHKGEIVLFSTQVTLSEDRTSSKHVGSSSGISVPVGHGIRVRTGSSHGRTVKSTKLTKIDQGQFTVTTQRLIFTGTRGSIVLLTTKILNTMLYKDGVEVRIENRQKREVFLCTNPRLLNTYILAAMRLSSR